MLPASRLVAPCGPGLSRDATAQRRTRGRLRGSCLRLVRALVVHERVVDVLRAPVRARGSAARRRREVPGRRGTVGVVPLAAGTCGAGRCGAVTTCIRGRPRSCGGRAVSSVTVNCTTTGLAPTKVRTASTWKRWGVVGSRHQRRTSARTVTARLRARASKWSVFLVRIASGDFVHSICECVLRKSPPVQLESNPRHGRGTTHPVEMSPPH